MQIKSILQAIPQTAPEVYWAIITALGAAVVGLFWQLMRMQAEHSKSLLDVTSKAIQAILAVNQNVSSLENALKLVEKIDAITADRHKK